MAYTKTKWTETTAITPTRLNNLESQYDKVITEVNSSTSNSTIAYNAVNAHVSQPSPHVGHVKGTMRITASVTAPTAPLEGDIWIQI